MDATIGLLVTENHAILSYPYTFNVWTGVTVDIYNMYITLSIFMQHNIYMYVKRGSHEWWSRDFKFTVDHEQMAAGDKNVTLFFLSTKFNCIYKRNILHICFKHFVKIVTINISNKPVLLKNILYALTNSSKLNASASLFR